MHIYWHIFLCCWVCFFCTHTLSLCFNIFFFRRPFVRSFFLFDSWMWVCRIDWSIFFLLSPRFLSSFSKSERFCSLSSFYLFCFCFCCCCFNISILFDLHIWWLCAFLMASTSTHVFPQMLSPSIFSAFSFLLKTLGIWMHNHWLLVVFAFFYPVQLWSSHTRYFLALAPALGYSVDVAIHTPFQYHRRHS